MLLLFIGGLVSQARAQSADEIALFHQGLTSGCIYSFKTNPETVSVPADLRDGICVCVDKWFRDNNINTVEYVERNKSLMPKIVSYCFQATVGQ
jgi:hypothetical protein